jgi:Cdc6-like AAA superfamily ATPase
MDITSQVLTSIQKAFINFTLRAEKYSDEMLVDTFVDSAPLLDLLSNANGQVVYGRRGTGKTHALKYLAEVVRNRGEVPIYLDLRSVGSNTSIYNDLTSTSERN